MNPHEKRRRESIAKTWRYSEAMERAIELREKEPAKFDSLSASTKLSLGHYEESRRLARELGIDTSAPAGAGKGGNDGR